MPRSTSRTAIVAAVLSLHTVGVLAQVRADCAFRSCADSYRRRSSTNATPGPVRPLDRLSVADR